MMKGGQYMVDRHIVPKRTRKWGKKKKEKKIFVNKFIIVWFGFTFNLNGLKPNDQLITK